MNRANTRSAITRSARLLLRAEINAARWSVVGHTIEVSPSSIFVQTHGLAYIGDELQVTLSFPGLLEPLSLTGHVVSQSLPSEPGEPRGLTVALSFRRARDEQVLRDLLEQVASPDTESASLVPYRVLVVEDSSLIQQMFAHSVHRYFQQRAEVVDVDFADTVDSAWEMVQRESYNLAIVDYFLPELLGSELIRRMRSDHRIRSLPIIAVSVGGEAAREASLHAGADIFLDKPLVLRDLFATVGQLIPRRQYA